MIIETRRDVVLLSGMLHKNQWLTIRAAAGMLLRDFPEGIIVDCSGLQEVSESGAKTFLDAMKDIDAAHTRIIVANLPANVMQVLKSVPGVRSQLPIAESVDAARASLKMHRRTTNQLSSAQATGAKSRVVVVPLMAEVDLTYGADLAARYSNMANADLRLVYLLEVTRDLPLNAPLPAQEQAAEQTMQIARQFVANHSCTATEHIERVRDAVDGILVSIKSHNADLVLLGASHHAVEHEGHDRFDKLVDSLLHRAPCEVIIGRLRSSEAAI